VALPLTAAVPAVVPPLEHVVGAEACGPNTLKVTVPPAPAVAPDSAELIDVAAMAVPAVPDDGAVAVVAVALVTAVEAMPAPHVLDEAAL
jgi:hypothetical protein